MVNDFNWVERIRKQMKGYWITTDGALKVTFYVPSLSERFWYGLWIGWSWVSTER